MTNNADSSHEHTHVEQLVDDWDERIKAFRLKALEARQSGQKWQYDRWRAVVDTTVQLRHELINAMEWDAENANDGNRDSRVSDSVG